MNKDLFNRIVNANEDDQFSEIFASLNLNGYAILDKLECNTDTKNRLVRYTSFAYSFQSPMLKINRDDRTKSKIAILRKVGIDTDSDFIKAIIKNEEEKFQEYINWWLNVNSDPLEQQYFAGLELVTELTKFIMEGINVNFTGDDPKEAAFFIKMVKKDFDLKAKSYFNLEKVINNLEKTEKELQRRYDFLDGIIKKEAPDFFGTHKNRAERNAHKWRRQYESNQKQTYTAIPQG